MEAIWTHLDPVVEHLGAADLSDSAGTQRSLTEKFGTMPELQELCRSHIDELCPREAGTTRYGRLAKDRNGFSIDAVVSSGRGMEHTHPKGEINLCFALEGEPKFDGDGPGWVVYGPNTRHPANVEGGTMFMIYFLPGGEIEWHRG
jgi:hypothetical protein